MDNIFFQFHLDLGQIGLTHDPTWNPYPGPLHRWDVSRSRAEKLRTLDPEWDDTLWMWTRFLIHETDLFVCPGRAHPRIEQLDDPASSWLPASHDPCPYAWVPVITFAADGFWALRAAAEWGEQSRMLGEQGDLVFRVNRAEVEVQFWYGGAPINPEKTTRRPRQATVKFAQLVEAWESFSEEVRTQLLQVLPELRDHENYGPWFRDGLAYLSSQPL
jgi:hypothetical protein